MNNLPTEIWEHNILQFLQVYEIARISTTCKIIYDCYKSIYIIARDKVMSLIDKNCFVSNKEVAKSSSCGCSRKYKKSLKFGRSKTVYFQKCVLKQYIPDFTWSRYNRHNFNNAYGSDKKFYCECHKVFANNDISCWFIPDSLKYEDAKFKWILRLLIYTGVRAPRGYITRSNKFEYIKDKKLETFLNFIYEAEFDMDNYIIAQKSYQKQRKINKEKDTSSSSYWHREGKRRKIEYLRTDFDEEYNIPYDWNWYGTNNTTNEIEMEFIWN